MPPYTRDWGDAARRRGLGLAALGVKVEDAKAPKAKPAKVK
jgi:hypothetical protein